MTASIIPAPSTAFRAPTRAPARWHPTARRGAVATVVGAVVGLALAGVVLRPTAAATDSGTRPVSSAEVLAEMNARVRGASSEEPVAPVPVVPAPEAATTPPAGTMFRP